ncbi:Glycerophosphocholine phosphodiesterase, partial [Dimargaris verticillata]
MKFGKSLTNNAFPPWSKNYIAYKALKQHIKLAQLAKTKGTIAIEPHETEFFYDLNDELEKVNRFYLHKRSELERRVVALEAKFRQLLAVGAPPSPHFHLPSKVESHPYTAETVTNESLEGTDLENARSLLNSLVETRDHLHKLIRFSQVNKEGFRKILKKFDKKLGTKVQHEYMASR